MEHTYLLIAALPSSPTPYWTYLKSPRKNFRRRLYKFLCQTPGSLNRISPNFYKMYWNDCRLTAIRFFYLCIGCPAWQPRPSYAAVLRDRCVCVTCVVGRAVCLDCIKVNVYVFYYSAKTKLWSSNPFRNANVTNEDRRQIEGGSRQKLRVLTA